MLDWLLELDRDVFVYLNSFGSEAYDGLWSFITKQLHWTPVFLFLLYLTVKKFGWKQTALIILMIAVLIAFTDQTTNLFKKGFQRLRPVNNPEIAGFIRAVQHRSSFSFISGHASNSMAAAFFLYKVLKPHYKYMGFIFLWPFIFAYSRIYLGLHYPGDILAGFLWGLFTSSLILMLYKYLKERYMPEGESLK